MLERTVKTTASVKDTTTQTTTYTYGAASGVLLGISDDNSSISYSYNKKGQQTGESRSTGETLTYTYDKDGNQTGMTMSANNGGISQNLSYTYNYLGQMTEVKDNAANEVIAAYTYDGNGNITEKKTNGNSMITEYEYNESGLIKTIENQTVADPLRNIKGTYSKYSYNYYLDGNQSDATDVFNKTKTYTYDGAGRLKTEGDGNDWITYYYDERGNRSIMHNTYGDEAIYYSYDANNRLKGTEINLLESGIIPMSILPVKEETTTYQYDKNGNVISMHREIYENPYIGDDEDYIYDITYLKDETYEYDLLNRLTSYSQTNHKEGESVSADYAYDPTGMRISKQLENENKINYVWSGGNVIGEYGIDGIKTYIRGAGGEIVKTKDGNSEERYFAYNGHGDTTSIIEKSAESVSFGVTATYEYDAFGNLIEGSETGETKENSFLYNGQQTDEESGLIYLRNRYYNPEIGRFITEDPAKDGTNWYVYCGNNPIALVDPLGLFDYNTVLDYNPNQYSDDVLALQNELAYHGYLSADDRDGYFGQKTLNAVNAYKNDRGLWNDGEYYGKVGLTTWQSLGLIYRTQGDIDRGVTIFTEAEGRQLYDVTKMFNDQLWYSEQYLNEKWPVDRQIVFYQKVNHEGDWDIKIRESWDRTFGGTYPGSATSEVILYGEYSTPEIMGNIMYAYLGRCIGFSETILYWGGDYADGGWNGIKNSSDSPEDKAAIQKGFDLYNRKVG